MSEVGWSLAIGVVVQDGGATRVPGQPVVGSGGAGAGSAGPGPGGAVEGSVPVGPGAAAPTGLPWPMILMFAVMGFLMISVMMQGRKEKKRVAEMLGGLAKGDRVQTVGGLIGVIAEVDDDEIVLKIDESGQTRARFSKTSVARVLRESRERRAVSGEAEASPAA